MLHCRLHKKVGIILLVDCILGTSSGDEGHF